MRSDPFPLDLHIPSTEKEVGEKRSFQLTQDPSFAHQRALSNPSSIEAAANGLLVSIRTAHSRKAEKRGELKKKKEPATLEVCLCTSTSSPNRLC
jgi:hypothetical protein